MQMRIQPDLTKMTKRLLERRQVLAEQVSMRMEKIRSAGSSGSDVAGLAYDYAYRGHQLALLQQLENQLKEVVEALQRIEQGVYGICTRCGKPIMPERLDALPSAEHCIDCQRAEG